MGAGADDEVSSSSSWGFDLQSTTHCRMNEAMASSSSALCTEARLPPSDWQNASAAVQELDIGVTVKDHLP